MVNLHWKIKEFMKEWFGILSKFFIMESLWKEKNMA
jgi:hypothetical protein